MKNFKRKKLKQYNNRQNVNKGDDFLTQFLKGKKS